MRITKRQLRRLIRRQITENINLTENPMRVTITWESSNDDAESWRREGNIASGDFEEVVGFKDLAFFQSLSEVPHAEFWQEEENQWMLDVVYPDDRMDADGEMHRLIIYFDRKPSEDELRRLASSIGVSVSGSE